MKRIYGGGFFSVSSKQIFHEFLFFCFLFFRKFRKCIRIVSFNLLRLAWLTFNTGNTIHGTKELKFYKNDENV